MKNNFTFLFCLLVIGFLAPVKGNAQVVPEPPAQSRSQASWKDRVFFGGNGGILLGNVTLIQVQPIVGYRLTDRLSIGLGPNYTYIENRGISVNQYGGSLFSRMLLTNEIFLQGEYELLISQQDRIGTEESIRVTHPALLLGGGIRQPIGNNAALLVIAQYDVLQDANSLYQNGPVLRGGVVFGF